MFASAFPYFEADAELGVYIIWMKEYIGAQKTSSIVINVHANSHDDQWRSLLMSLMDWASEVM